MSSPTKGLEPKAEPLLALVRRFVAETQPELGARGVDLQSRFEADLGLDSLARVELLKRIEAALEISLPERALLAERVGDLLALAAAARPAAPEPLTTPPEPVALPTSQAGEPAEAGTLIEALGWHREVHPERVHLLLYGEGEEPQPISYSALWEGARGLAAGLCSRGLGLGETVAIMLPTSREYFESFFGILLAGGVPVPIYPPTRPSQLEEHLRRHARILENAGAAFLVTLEAAKGVAQLLRAQVAGLRQVLTAAELGGRQGDFQPASPGPNDLAFLQYTSGSTGDPKGVSLTHAHLLANIRAMGAAVGVRPDDVFVSWLPLYHDMGLIGAWLGSLYYGIPLVVMSPLSFLAQPTRWLRAIHRHRGTLSAAPNFAYELCLTKIGEGSLTRLDLSSWRWAFNGAEPVSPGTLEHFATRFRPYGLRRGTLAPVYGLAEAAVGLAFPPPERGPLIERVRREPFRREGRAEPAAAEESDILQFVACGRALPGYRIRVADEAGAPLPERREGRVQFQGPSATSGYYRNPEASRRLFQDGWLETGDRGYLAGDELYVTGRVKDLIIRGGRNFYPYDLEEAVGGLSGIRKGCVVAFGVQDPATGSERLVVVAETRQRDPARREALGRAVRERSLEVLGVPPDEVVLVPPHAVLKTSSGKLRRGAVRERYLAGTLDQPIKAVWRQVLAAGWQGVRTRVGAALAALTRPLFGIYGWLVFLLLAVPTWLGVVLLPRPAWRWGLVRGAIRTLRWLTFTPLEVLGREQLPPPGRPFVLAANHSSYLDALALIEAIPRPLCYVAKRELAGPRYSRWFLERLDTLFVERFDLKRSAAEAEQLGAAVAAGHSLAFFPEGTFRSEPGLLPFRMGAFVTAAEGGLPLVPLTLNGTRRLLGGGSLWPRPSRIRVVIGPPLWPDGRDWAAAVRLRDRARAAILRHSDEPDAGARAAPGAD